MRLTPASLRPWRSSIRARIVIACAGLFLVPGAILTGVAYTQIGHVLVVPYAPQGEVSSRQGNVTYFDAGNDPHIRATRDASKQRGFLEFALAGLGLGTLLAAGSAGQSAAAYCGRWPPSPRRRRSPPRRTWTSGWHWPDRPTSSRNWPTPSMRCSPG